MKTAVCDQLGCKFPIFAFSHSARVVAEVTRAGGVGVLGALGMSPSTLDESLSWIESEVGDLPYGIDIVVPATVLRGSPDEGGGAQLKALIPDLQRRFARDLVTQHGGDLSADVSNASAEVLVAGLDVDQTDGQVDIALQHHARLLVNALGPAPRYLVDQAHDRGRLVGGLVGSAHHAALQLDSGVDLLVAQGTEAGGHTGEISTLVLTPEICDVAAASGRPVLAAGGIGRGRQIAAALALGAQGVWTGSIWLTTAESDTPARVQRKLLAASASDTVRSRARSGKPCRLLRTAWTDAWGALDAPPTLPMPLQGLLYAELSPYFESIESDALIGEAVGQIVGAMNAVRPVATVVAELVRECMETLDGLASARTTEADR